MKTKRLTIGIPTYNDYDGVYFSLQSIRLYHSEILADLEFVVIDNNPSSAQGKTVKKLCDGISLVKYVDHPECRGPADSKNQVFIKAETPYVLCMDSHVLFEAGALKKLLNFYSANPDTHNLHQGPLVYDCLKSISTHFDPVWRGHMYGTWATDKRGEDPNGEPFEIPMQGMGVFSCAKDAWPRFNDRFYGFGGEEGYIHDKFKAASARTLCLPFLRWVHRFDRPAGVEYPLDVRDRIKNYFIGFLELGKDLQEIFDHFKEEAPDVDCHQLLQEVKGNKNPQKKISDTPKVSSIKFNTPLPVKYLKIEFFSDCILSGIKILPAASRGKEYKATLFSSSSGIQNPSGLCDKAQSPCIISGVDDFKEITLEYNDLMYPSCINIHHDANTRMMVYSSVDAKAWASLSQISA